MAKFVAYTSEDGICTDLRYYDADGIDYGDSLPARVLALTEEQWQQRIAGGRWAVKDGREFVPAPPTPEDARRERLAAGLMVEPAGVPIPLDPASVGTLRGVAADFAQGLGLPGNKDSYTLLGLDDHALTLTGPQWVQVYKAARDLLVAMDEQVAIARTGGVPVWPPQIITIS